MDTGQHRLLTVLTRCPLGVVVEPHAAALQGHCSHTSKYPGAATAQCTLLLSDDGRLFTQHQQQPTANTTLDTVILTVTFLSYDGTVGGENQMKLYILSENIMS